MRLVALPLVLLLAGVCAPSAVADVLEVPAEFPTIQAAVNAAADGDEIRIAGGTYHENIDLLGKALRLRGAGPAATVLDGTSSGRVLLIENPRGGEVLIEDLAITGGLAPTGGGLLAIDADVCA